MCGIGGYVGLDEVTGAPVLAAMTRAQRHRGPDGDGTFTGRAFGLAHQRLAIIDRARGAQPMVSPDGRYVLSYNGEVYNYRDLRAELTMAGRTFRTDSDTEVVLAAYERWGTAAFDRFNGMFALAVADTVTGRVVLARDQFGIKPLHLATGPAGETLFASEIGALLATGRLPRRPDDTTVYRYLRHRVHDDTERTFFDGIRRLLPGHLAILEPDGTATVEPYTHLYAELRDLASRPQPYDAAARERFARALSTAIRLRLVSEVPVGTALSGGLDSSTIVASLDRLLGQQSSDAGALGSRQQTFSAVFPGQINDEERYVDAVAARCSDRLRVHKVYPEPEGLVAELTDFVRTQQEPVISTGPYAQYCVMRKASRHVTVMLDGQGADELLAGYAPYVLVHLRELRRSGDNRRAAGELARSADVLWRLGRFRVADSLRRRSRTPITDLLDPDFAAAHADETLQVVRDDVKRRLEDDLFRQSLPALLRYEDRNTMRFSMEGRVPFLDMDLLRALWTLDNSAIIGAGWNKRALRDSTAGLLPSKVHRRRNKIGFTTPERAWFLTIHESLREILSSPSFRDRPYWRQEAVLRAFDDFVAGKGAAETMAFWRLVNVELWLRTFIDTVPATLRTGSGSAEQAPTPQRLSGRRTGPTAVGG
ncbi:asparagine synthase (glutamine-hydrolyzing) [Actinopolymorpha singaporensis]|uniref:asparagine synthase (glutamine-hydrolyzing) n=1 Tax=Actinopolymorpha singaporensis TaxID=117157 RepID=A0A1H1TS58_9ACTN|nr:asparagine synthase (glutamine-hydrolyzing) [Actinopolymorpha singaporensis]SDS62911.1 asparagine synthase (glutamine-hydrolysing) [Actinopolymorpha singaporensis]